MKCLYYQWKISRALDDGKPLPVDHIAQCAACGEFYRKSLSLGTYLRQDAMSPETVHSPHADNPMRIIPLYTSPAHRVLRRVGLAAACSLVAACLLAAILLFQSHRHVNIAKKEEPQPSPQQNSQIKPSQPTNTSLAMADPVRMLTDLASAPIRHELDNASHDAKNAGEFLISCLPMGVKTQSPPNDQ